VAATELKAVLASGQFRRLFTVRATGQFCDGMFQSALATFVLFSPERQPTAIAIAITFALLYLPFALVGPFGGVALDRWNRRQVLLVGNLLRALVAIVVVLLTVAGHSGIDLGIAVLIVLGINRFILAGLSAALPHTVPADSLVTANAFAPTAGTLISAMGGLLGVAIRSLLGGGDQGSTIVLVITVVGFAVSGLLALRIARTALGPEDVDFTDDWRSVLKGLVSAFAVIWRAKGAFRGIALVTIHRIAFGAAFVLVLLLLRNTLNRPTNPDGALSGLALVVGGAAGGALVAAILTPVVSRKIGPTRWSALTLILAAVITPIGLAIATMPSLIIGATALGFAGQAVKIGGDTAVQQEIADDHRGRVFALYDVVINTGLVLGVFIAALSSPTSGRDSVALTYIAISLFATALWALAGIARRARVNMT